MPPQIPDKILCNSDEQLQQELTDLRDKLDKEENENSWEPMQRALMRFKALIKGGAHQYESFVPGLKSTARLICQTLISERGRLSSAAVELCATIAQNLGRRFEPLIVLFVPSLLKLCQRPNKVAINRAQACINDIISNTETASILPLLREALKEKSISLRVVAAEASLLTLTRTSAERMGEKVVEIETIIKISGRDAHPDVRKHARVICGLYQDKWPLRYQSFIGPLTPVTRKYLDIKTTAQPPSRPVSAIIPNTISLDPPPKRTLPQSSSQASTSSEPVPTIRRTASVRSGPARVLSTSQSSRPNSTLVVQESAPSLRRVASRPFISTQPPDEMPPRPKSVLGEMNRKARIQTVEILERVDFLTKDLDEKKVERGDQRREENYVSKHATMDQRTYSKGSSTAFPGTTEMLPPPPPPERIRPRVVSIPSLGEEIPRPASALSSIAARHNLLPPRPNSVISNAYEPPRSMGSKRRMPPVVKSANKQPPSRPKVVFLSVADGAAPLEEKKHGLSRHLQSARRAATEQAAQDLRQEDLNSPPIPLTEVANKPLSLRPEEVPVPLSPEATTIRMEEKAIVSKTIDVPVVFPVSQVRLVSSPEPVLQSDEVAETVQQEVPRAQKPYENNVLRAQPIIALERRESPETMIPPTTANKPNNNFLLDPAGVRSRTISAASSVSSRPIRRVLTNSGEPSQPTGFAPKRALKSSVTQPTKSQAARAKAVLDQKTQDTGSKKTVPVASTSSRAVRPAVSTSAGSTKPTISRSNTLRVAETKPVQATARVRDVSRKPPVPTVSSLRAANAKAGQETGERIRTLKKSASVMSLKAKAGIKAGQSTGTKSTVDPLRVALPPSPKQATLEEMRGAVSPPISEQMPVSLPITPLSNDGLVHINAPMEDADAPVSFPSFMHDIKSRDETNGIVFRIADGFEAPLKGANSRDVLLQELASA